MLRKAMICAAAAVLGAIPSPRVAALRRFLGSDGGTLDQGLAMYFPAPGSFTGEHVLELQGHGGVLIMDMLVQRVLALGSRLARPGEFSERAFLNGKMDVAQAEAVADLIDAGTTAAILPVAWPFLRAAVPAGERRNRAKAREPATHPSTPWSRASTSTAPRTRRSPPDAGFRPW